MHDVVKKVFWLKKFILDLDVGPAISNPIILLCDNDCTIAQEKKAKISSEEIH